MNTTTSSLSSRTLAGAALLGLSLSMSAGCYFNPSAPTHYYNAPKVELATLPVRLPGTPRGRVKTPHRPLIMPLWTSFVTNPVGGLYDQQGGVVPLQATFFHPNVALPVWEASARRFRRYGLRTYKDYGDVGTAVLLSSLSREVPSAKEALIVRGRLRSLAHNQARNAASREPRFEAVKATLEVDLMDTRGRLLWRKELVVYCKKPIKGPSDLLAALGQSVSDELLREGTLYRLLTTRGELPTFRPTSRPSRPSKAAPRPTLAATNRLLDTLGDTP